MIGSATEYSCVPGHTRCRPRLAIGQEACVPFLTRLGAAARKTAPRGVSLVEVLISIFVLSIGLVGLAALIPVGGIAIVETAKSDRAGTCGRAALREIEVRGLADPQYWTNPQPTLNGSAVALDPVGVNAGMGGSLGLLPRITFQGITPEVVRNVFYWKDDLHVHVPDDPDHRSHLAYYQPDGSMGPTPTPYPAFDGQYSWLMTVSPALSEVPLPLNQRKLYEVSVAVCYRRSLSPPSFSAGDWAAEAFGSPSRWR